MKIDACVIRVRAAVSALISCQLYVCVMQHVLLSRLVSKLCNAIPSIMICLYILTVIPRLSIHLLLGNSVKFMCTVSRITVDIKMVGKYCFLQFQSH